MMYQIPEWYQKHMNKRVQTKKRTRTMMRAEKYPTSQTTRIMKWRGDASKARHSSDVELKPRREAHRTQENVLVKRQLMAKSSKRHVTLVPPPEDPVKRRLLKKTDMRNDESVMNVDENLLNVVSILTKDENIPVANSNEDNEFTVLDDHEEMMKGKAEGAELTERNGYNDSCKKV